MTAPAAPPTLYVSRWLFLRLLAVVYVAAFLSLWVQVDGLIGSRGILPVRDFLPFAERVLGAERYYQLPTLFWLNASDTALHGACAAGVVLSVLLLIGIAPVPVLALLWALYLSLTVAGQEFLGYQWDSLLLETGLLAVFFAPPQLWPREATEGAPSAVVVWLLRWLLFRLMFASGVAKLASGDPTWRDFTALAYHYETQPLPTWTSWYMHQLPDWFGRLSVGWTYLVEIVLPVGIFGPRRLRQVVFTGFLALQVLIAATGNFGFFNLLSAVLCLPLLDDACFPARWRARFQTAGSRRCGWGRWLPAGLAAGVLFLSVGDVFRLGGVDVPWSAAVGKVRRLAEPFRAVNHYGLFSVMTTERDELIVEGSNDGETWRPYTFKYKPADVMRRPTFCGLHMPRLDWQMWFAALGDYQDNPWFERFLVRLMEGEPVVLGLLADNPFPEGPPRHLRAMRYRYRFTDWQTGRHTGAWWQRELVGYYSPTLERQP